MFSNSKTLFNMLFLNEMGPLGRWSQERCAIKLNKKIVLIPKLQNKNYESMKNWNKLTLIIYKKALLLKI